MTDVNDHHAFQSLRIQYTGIQTHTTVPAVFFTESRYHSCHQQRKSTEGKVAAIWNGIQQYCISQLRTRLHSTKPYKVFHLQLGSSKLLAVDSNVTAYCRRCAWDILSMTDVVLLLLARRSLSTISGQPLPGPRCRHSTATLGTVVARQILSRFPWSSRTPRNTGTQLFWRTQLWASDDLSIGGTFWARWITEMQIRIMQL